MADNDPTSDGVTPYSPTRQATESPDPVPQSGGSNTASAGNIIANVQVVSTNLTPSPRATQQTIQPSAVQGRNINLISDSGSSPIIVSADISDGASAIAYVTTTSNSGGLIMTEVFWQLYVDNPVPGNALPQNVSSKQFPFYSWNSINDWTVVNDVNKITTDVSQTTSAAVSAMQVRNASGDGSVHQIFWQVYIRSFQNGSGAKSN